MFRHMIISGFVFAAFAAGQDTSHDDPIRGGGGSFWVEIRTRTTSLIDGPPYRVLNQHTHHDGPRVLHVWEGPGTYQNREVPLGAAVNIYLKGKRRSDGQWASILDGTRVVIRRTVVQGFSCPLHSSGPTAPNRCFIPPPELGREARERLEKLGFVGRGCTETREGLLSLKASRPDLTTIIDSKLAVMNQVWEVRVVGNDPSMGFQAPGPVMDLAASPGDNIHKARRLLLAAGSDYTDILPRAIAVLPAEGAATGGNIVDQRPITFSDGRCSVFELDSRHEVSAADVSSFKNANGNFGFSSDGKLFSWTKMIYDKNPESRPCSGVVYPNKKDGAKSPN